MPRLARSYLSAPGSHERLLSAMFTAGADAVMIVHEVFAPDAHEMADARTLVDAVTRAASVGAGAYLLDDGQVVDARLVARARDLLALADHLESATHD